MENKGEKEEDFRDDKEGRGDVGGDGGQQGPVVSGGLVTDLG